MQEILSPLPKLSGHWRALPLPAVKEFLFFVVIFVPEVSDAAEAFPGEEGDDHTADEGDEGERHDDGQDGAVGPAKQAVVLAGGMHI